MHSYVLHVLRVACPRVSLPSVTQDAQLVLGALCVLGGFTETLRVGGAVKISTGTPRLLIVLFGLLVRVSIAEAIGCGVALLLTR